MEQSLKVCVTGAAGQIGYSFVPLLLTGQVFGKTRIDLRLLDIPPALKILDGLIAQIHDGAYPLLKKVISSTDPLQAFENVDVIVFLGGFPRKKGMQRKDLLHANKQIFMSQGQALKVANPNVRCVVVANPANTNAYILNHFSQGKVKPENITCLSRLDHNRAISQLFLKANCESLDEIQDVVVFGNHSLTQYPSVTIPKIRGEPLSKVLDEKWLQGEFIESVQKRGAFIMDLKNSSSVCSAANAVKDHLYDWYRGTNGKIVSMGVVSAGDYGIPSGVWTSLPVRCKDFSYQVVKDLELTEFCKEKISITSKELEDEIKDASI